MNELVSVVQSEAAALAQNNPLIGDYVKEDTASLPITGVSKSISGGEPDFSQPFSPKNTNSSREFSPTSTSTPKSSSPSKSSKSQKNPAFSSNSSSNFSSYLNSVLSGREAAAHLNLLSQSTPHTTTESTKTPISDSQTQVLTTSLATPVSTTVSTPSTSNGPTTTTSSTSVVDQPESPTSDQLLPNTQSTNSTQVVVYPQSNEKERYVDITEYLSLPQTEAARRLNIPTSTLSKRWKEAVVNRKWPYRTICKLDKEIMTLLHNIPHGPDAPPLPPEIEGPLGLLLKKRQEELRTVIIRL